MFAALDWDQAPLDVFLLDLVDEPDLPEVLIPALARGRSDKGLIETLDARRFCCSSSTFTWRLESFHGNL